MAAHRSCARQTIDRRRLSDPQGKGGEATAGVHRGGRRPLRDGLHTGRVREQLFYSHAHLHPGQGSARTDVDSRAIQQVCALVAVRPIGLGILENPTVTVGGDPDQRDAFAGSDLPATDFNRTGGDAPIGHQRPVNPQNLLDSGGQ